MPVCAEENAMQQNKPRNQAMDLCKLIASVFVVFDHAVFPGKLGSILICLCSFAVPMFFMISGYNNYHASSTQIRRRTIGIVKLMIIGTLFQIVGTCIATELKHGSTMRYLLSVMADRREIVRWAVLHVHPYAGHLWYLNAMIAVYLVFDVFTRFQRPGTWDYRPFYCLSGSAFLLLFAFGTILPASGAEELLHVRNGWFVGIPMFGAGLFLREYQERILDVFTTRKGVLFAVIVGGALFSLLERETVGTGLIPFGMYFTIAALMLLMVSHPVISHGSGIFSAFLRHCGSVSTWIYLFHLFFVTKYETFLQPTLQRLAGNAEPYLYPLCILALSILNAILWEVGSCLIKHRPKAAQKPKV